MVLAVIGIGAKKKTKSNEKLLLCCLALFLLVTRAYSTPSCVSYLRMGNHAFFYPGDPSPLGCSPTPDEARKALEDRVHLACKRVPPTHQLGGINTDNNNIDISKRGAVGLGHDYYFSYNVRNLPAFVLLMVPIMIAMAELVRPSGTYASVPYVLFVMLASALHVSVISALYMQDTANHASSQVAACCLNSAAQHLVLRQPICNGGGTLIAKIHPALLSPFGLHVANLVGPAVALVWVACAASAYRARCPFNKQTLLPLLSRSIKFSR